MSRARSRAVAGVLIALTGAACARASEPPVVSSQPVRLIAEAEDFKVERGAWRVVPYRENYFASTFAVTFLSRMACLGAPAQAPAGDAVASQRVDVPTDGDFQVLARYEQPFAFSAEFTLEIEQGGRSVFRQVYGRLEDPKIWAFNKHERTGMERLAWGGTDNIVWQQAGPARLKAGSATIRLVAGPQLENGAPRAQAAERHIDAVVLTTDRAGLEAQKKTTYLELDGWLVQDGDLFVRFTNPKDASGPVLPVVEPYVQGEHSPYSVHVRDWPTTRVFKSGRLTSPQSYVLAGPRSAAVRSSLLAPVLDPTTFTTVPDSEYLEPGETSAWVPLGPAVDALNDSAWIPKAERRDAPKNDRAVDLEAEFAVPDGRGGLRSIRRLHVTGDGTSPRDVSVLVPGNVTARPLIQTPLEALRELEARVAAFPKHGSVPKRFPIYGLLAFSDAIQNPGPIGEEATKLALALGDNTLSRGSGPWTERLGVPERKTSIATHWPLDQVEKSYANAEKQGRLGTLGIVSYGDEIRIEPGKDESVTAADFVPWLRTKSVVDGGQARFTDDPQDPWYYYSRLFLFDRRLAKYTKATDWIASKLGPEVRTGINYGPHSNYLVDSLHFVRPFEQGALTLPWSEDYTWQIPEFSQQVTGYLVSGLRAGARSHDLPILMYVMPHSPGNIPRDFRLSFYTAIAHGARAIHYFCASPLAVGTTENYIATEDLDMWRAVYDATHDAGVFEDYVMDGRVRPARVGLLLSSVDEIRTGDSNSHGGIHNQERKAIYYALRHSEIPVDFVTEDELIAGRGKDLDLIYVTQQFLHSRTVGVLTQWVEAGGTLVALVGGGFLDEFGRDNPATHALYGIKDQSLWKDPALPMVLAKQDLPPYAPIDQAAWDGVTAPVLVWKQTLAPSDALVLGTYKNGAPAVVEKARGKGRAVLFGFFPGMAYLKSGLPLRPVDRSASAGGFDHFLPTAMDSSLRKAIVDAFLPAGFVRPVETSEPLVEATLIATPTRRRLAIPLLNFTGLPCRSLTVRLRSLGRVRSIRSVERGTLTIDYPEGATVVTLPLDVADMLLIDLQ